MVIPIKPPSGNNNVTPRNANVKSSQQSKPTRRVKDDSLPSINSQKAGRVGRGRKTQTGPVTQKSTTKIESTNKKRSLTQENNESDVPEVSGESIWRVDPKTGVKYKTIPKTEWLEDGFSVTHIDEELKDSFTDLNQAANTFLAHLRVPPSKDEILRLRKEKAQRIREQNAEYQKTLKDENNDD